MNVNDSEVMTGLLDKAGYSQADSPETADVILINTCCVRQKAEDKAFGYALGLVAPKMRKPGRIIGIIGCIAEKDKDNIFKKLPFIDLVVGPGQEAHVVQLIEEIRQGGQKVISTGEHCGEYPSVSAKRIPSTQAFVTIMFGCNNFCSYCVVPYVRGKEISRPVKDIIEEIKGLDKKIFKEVVLLGQNVNSYKGSGVRGKGLGGLLKEVHEIDGVERIRFITSHPRDMSDEIIDAVRDLPKVCEYFHIPLQSGDDEILKMMNRGYTADHFRKLVGRIRSKIPDATITSDAIAGFPGETEEQFGNTLKLIEELDLDLVNTFSYSSRPGTPAEKMEGQLSEEVRSERLHRMMGVVEASALNRNKALVGKELEVLVCGKGGGRTRGNKVVNFEVTDEQVGKIVKVKIIGASAWGLKASV
jgi:tRNA-2-methylthio-N6-dimethylallyladenosine synthase